jgi:N-terminal domain of anti-restriction factor ArdC
MRGEKAVSGTIPFRGAAYAKLPKQPRAEARPLPGTHRQDCRRARGRTAPCRRPWDPNAYGGSTTPVNAATGHRYRGVNLFVLGMPSRALVSNDPRWCSYRQAAARGWQVRKGEKATPVYFYKLIEIEDKTSDSGQETRRIPILRTFSVFHASQVDGIPALAPPAPPPLRDPPCAAPLGRAALKPNASAMSSTSRESGATSTRRSIEGFASARLGTG